MKRYSAAFNTWYDDYTTGEAFYIGNRHWSVAELAREYGWRGIVSARRASEALAERGIRTLNQLARTDPDTLRTAGMDLPKKAPRIGDHAIKLLELILIGEGSQNDLWTPPEQGDLRTTRSAVVKRTRNVGASSATNRLKTETTPLTQ
jgi:hypothetical protein